MMDTPKDMLITFVRESNRIEGINRVPTPSEIAAHERLLARSTLTVDALKEFVTTVQPGAALREGVGMDVRVGTHHPPLGGPAIVSELRTFLLAVNNHGVTPFAAHVTYETLHPFTDGNGRSGRAIWLWMMSGHAPLGFLHKFYYQTLDGVR